MECQTRSENNQNLSGRSSRSAILPKDAGKIHRSVIIHYRLPKFQSFTHPAPGEGRGVPETKLDVNFYLVYFLSFTYSS